ncbi:MAG: MetQ/NlpA family ABC transporter substrate-binding protein [Coriobacteriia bacterium]|nr:MetQ/NlpA family ABC transporter substrate-binding protein [Coriobacteriia bacterium]
MKRKFYLALTVVLSAVLALSLVACGGSGGAAGTDEGERQGGFSIAVPSDTTNEARALLLLEAQGLITLSEGAGLAATKIDIVDNPFSIEILEVEAAALPRTLPDVDFAVINGNFALSSGIDTSTALAGEDPNSEAAQTFANLIAVRADDISSEKTLALVEVLQGSEVQQFITSTYGGAVIPVNIPAGLTSSGQTPDDTVIRVGASPAPHAEILEFARPLIEARGFTLEIIEFSDYVLPNIALEDGDLDANYFQHLPYLENFNEENNTNIVSAGKIHFEPLCIYPGKSASLSDIR